MIRSGAGLGVQTDLQLHVHVNRAAEMPLGTSVALSAFATELLKVVKKGASCKELQKVLRDWVSRQPNDGLSRIWINVK